jgi:hypothetical protein
MMFIHFSLLHKFTVSDHVKVHEFEQMPVSVTFLF